MVLHNDWRGEYDIGSYAGGTLTKPCVRITRSSNFQTVTSDGTISDYPKAPGPINTSWYHCVEVEWPAPHVWVTRETRNRSLNGPLAWMGTLIDGMRDNSGQMYMRNRYYDPASGRFTQEDPIGLAGGLNAYGFAGGDPVSYDDPYGLCPHYNERRRRCPGNLGWKEYAAVEEAIGTLNESPERVRLNRMLKHGQIRKVSRTYYGAPAAANYSDIDLMEGFFTGNQKHYETGYDTPGERGWVLGHELGHIVQWETGKLVADQNNPNIQPDRGRIRALFYSQTQGENRELQHDADLLGCRLATRQRGVWESNCH